MDLEWIGFLFPMNLEPFQVFMPLGDLYLKGELARTVQSAIPELVLEEIPTALRFLQDPVNYPNKLDRYIGKDDYDYLLTKSILEDTPTKFTYFLVPAPRLWHDEEQGEEGLITSEIAIGYPEGGVDRFTISFAPAACDLHAFKPDRYHSGIVVSDKLFALIQPFLDEPYWFWQSIELG